jgi:hypothetical protein
MDAFTQWKQEVDAEQDRLENTGQQLSEAEQLRRIDMYWVSVVRDIKPDDPNAFRKIQTIRRFANRAGGEYPLTYAALRSLPPLDNAPSLARMRREIDEAANDLRRRNPSSTSHDLVDMMDSKLTNYISDLRKDDPKYLEKKKYFKELLWTGMLPNAAATFERKGHGVPYSMERIQEEAIAARQQVSDNDARAQASPSAGVPWTVGPGGRKTRRRRKGKGGKPPKTATVVVSNPIASLPRPPKPNPAAGTGLFPGGRKRKHTRRHRRRS